MNWFIGRLVQLGLLEDEGLNVIAFDGTAKQTVSVHVALAARAGKWWGCIGCGILSRLVQYQHCKKVLTGVPMNGWNYLRAAFFITLVLAAIGWGGIGVWHLLIWLAREALRAVP